MSSDYYFYKWKETLSRLEKLVLLDQEYQITKILDKKRCDAVIRLCGILGEYIVLYNMAMDCWQQNLQVQKTSYISRVVRAVTDRILELKHSIRQLESSDTQFLGHGLANHKLTAFDAELADVLEHEMRPNHVTAAVQDAFRKAEETRELMRAEEEESNVKAEEAIVDNWWDEDNAGEDQSVRQSIEETPESEEMLQTRKMAAMIQAQERARQVTRWCKKRKLQREMWEKELSGTLQPAARFELRERSAKLIQKVLRSYFELKRRKIQECKEDEILGIRLCKPFNKDAIYSANEIKNLRKSHREEFEQQWTEFRKKLKEDYKTRKSADIADDYRDLINAWFRKWFDDIKYFPDFPRENEGGTNLIMKEEIPDPKEWWEIYQKYLEEQKSNKNKSKLQQKYEKQAADAEERMRKKEELLKRKLEEKMKQKLMKNPTKHPGFNYPSSKKTEHILETIISYKKDWGDLDHTECLEVKKKFVPEVDKDQIYAEVKMDLMQINDEDMRKELKVLKTALKRDYITNEEKYPEPMKIPRKRKRRQKKVKSKKNDNITEILEDLALKGILKEYPQTILGDFLGDHNFAGDDIRCNYEPAPHFSGETRAFWWEKCRDATHGCHKILVVGPPKSGKTVLVHGLATVTDAVLFELDAFNMRNQMSSTAHLQRLLNSVTICAKAVQPSVIYIKHIHRFFYRKVPPAEANLNLDVMKRKIVKMLKKISKTDRITVVGTCVDPWLTKSNQLLKQFPVVLLVPDMTYSAVFQLLNYWMSENHIVPRNLDLQSLAFVLRGYSYGYLAETLGAFLTPERIISIAARGLQPMEIYNYFLMRDTEKIDFEKYKKWYAEKTAWGKKEAKHIEEQREFKRLTEMYLERKKKKKLLSAPNSATTLPSRNASDGEGDD